MTVPERSHWSGFIALALLMSITACVERDLGIGSTVTDCCRVDYARYASFELFVEALPNFLQPIVSEELTRALEGRGLERASGNGDLLVELALIQVDLNEQLPRDPFQGRLDPGGEIRFLADLRIRMVDSTSGDVVWEGVVSRIHDVVPGETMPLERAQAAIGAAFDEVLGGYPMRVE